MSSNKVTPSENADVRCTTSDQKLIQKWCKNVFGAIDLLLRGKYEVVLRQTKEMLTLYGPRHCIYQLQRQAFCGLRRDAEAGRAHSQALEVGSICLLISNRARELGNEAFVAGQLDEAHRYYVIGQSYNLCDMRLPLNLSAVLMRKGDYDYASDMSLLAFNTGMGFGAPQNLMEKAIARRVASLSELPFCSCPRPWLSDARRQLAKRSNVELDDAVKSLYDKITVGTTPAFEIERYLAFCWTKRPAIYAIVASHYTAAIALSPSTGLLHADRAICQLRMGSFEDGLFDAENAVRLATVPDASAHWLVGMCQHALERFESASAAFATAAAIEPTNNTYVLSNRMLSGSNHELFAALVDKLQVSVPNNTR